MFLQRRLGREKKTEAKAEIEGLRTVFLPVRKSPEEKWGKADKFSLECFVPWDRESISGLMTLTTGKIQIRFPT